MSEPVCPRIGYSLRGCRFEARYDLGAAKGMPDMENVSRSEAVEIIAQFRAKTYVRDVCVTCGRTIERQGSAA